MIATQVPPPVDMINVQIDGEWMQVPKGTRIIEAIKTAGKFVPHYCYHPKLSSPGNCRMCLIEMGMPKMGADRKPVMGADGRAEIGWIPRPAIACANTVAEGMGIRTESPMVKDCQNGVMELLLINHPLDCPICDQAGECKLQEYSVEYGTGQSRFVEEKVKKPKMVDLGSRVMLDDERCILCSRCVRFCKEVANDDVLGFVNRGSHNTLTCHPGKTLENNYSLNTVDICPVGALTSKDFRFKMRVWFLKETKSICVDCGTGCNTLVGSRENVIYRQTPRENNDVNSSWMCDAGRLNYKYVHDPARLHAVGGRSVTGPRVTSAEVFRRIAAALRTFAPGEVAIIASARSTNEELFLIRRLADELKVTETEIVPRTGAADGILVSADRNPNTQGARMLGVTDEPGRKLPQIAQGVRQGSIKALLAFGEDVTGCGLSHADLSRLSLLVTSHYLPMGSDAAAHYILPTATWAEKRGTMVNIKGRLQKLHRALEPKPGVMDDWEAFQGILCALGGAGFADVAGVFVEMAGTVPALGSLTLGRLSDQGVQIL